MASGGVEPPGRLSRSDGMHCQPASVLVRAGTPPGDVVMRVENLTSTAGRSFRGVSYDLRKGEIFGVGGLVGAQRTELVEAIFGLRDIRAGNIWIEGKSVEIHNPMLAKKNRMALLTEDRRATGVFPVLSVFDNTLIANLDRYVATVLRLMGSLSSCSYTD
jgi:methyl-galactoside transport system ATP-binding protein